MHLHRLNKFKVCYKFYILFIYIQAIIINSIIKLTNCYFSFNKEIGRAIAFSSSSKELVM